MKKLFYISAFLIGLSFFSYKKEDFSNVVSVDNDNASGKFSLFYKDDSTKINCKDINVYRGNYDLCVKKKKPDYDFFIERNKTRGEWFKKLFRVYDYFPPITNKDPKVKWFEFEKRNSRFIKEDFKGVEQENGLTFKHHESSKGLVSYRVANLQNDVADDEGKMHQNYDWDENISGKYETYFPNGKRKFSHKYLINRYSILDQNLTKSRIRYSIDIKLSGTIKEWHENFRKKALITYQESYIVEKKLKSKQKKVEKTKRTAQVTQWHDNGKLHKTGQLLNGLEQGTWYVYDKSGSMVEKIEYAIGKKSGKYTSYYPDTEKVKTKGQYVNGKKTGKWEAYDKNGKKTIVSP